MCCSLWGGKELDMTERLNGIELKEYCPKAMKVKCKMW